MTLIKDINHVELPNWFTKDRYLKIKKSPVNVIDDQLALRRYLDQESRKSNFDDIEYKDLFEGRPSSCQEKTSNNYEFLDENVRALSTFDVAQMRLNLL
ncbi:MAG: hypothetical protein OQK03_12970, partial [Colwellia sp.]|nr:hypothetical protein [Colwellia sp.]